MRIFIPPESLGVARELDLQGWVGGKNWQRDRYFQMLDRCRQVLAVVGDEQMDNPEAIVYAMAAVLNYDAPFQDYVLNKRQLNLGDQKVWFDRCRAAAWAIIQRYSKEVDKGEWKTDLSEGQPNVP